MQESPVVQQFVMMDLGPGFDEALLRSWQRAADTLNRIEVEHGAALLVGSVEVRSVMRSAEFWKHADGDSKESRDFRHRRTLHPPQRSCRGNACGSAAALDTHRENTAEAVGWSRLLGRLVVATRPIELVPRGENVEGPQRPC